MYYFIIGKIITQNEIELYNSSLQIIAIGVLANAKLIARHASPPQTNTRNLILVLKNGLISSHITSTYKG